MVLPLLLLGALAFATSAWAAGPTIASDRADYAPGDTVNLTGTGWQFLEPVHISVNDSAGTQWSLESFPDPLADPNGNVAYSFQLPTYFISNYTVTATGPISGVATTTFTDVNIGTYDQCSNDTGTGYTSGDTGCRWINGNLQSNNSIYVEGDATVQRLWLTDLVPGSTHTFTLSYGTTKGGKHAYDFLTTWSWSENWITDDDRCQDITGCTAASLESKLDIPQDPNVPNSFEPSAPGDRQFVMRGGTLNSATTPTIFSGDYTGDSETRITVTFNVGPSSGAMCSTKQGTTTCGVALWFGAHVAAQANWGLGLGAGSISGSPYHVALVALDGAAVGSRDNQMQAGVVTVIPNGTIVIVKDAQPNDPQDFSFNLNNNSTISQSFSLDDDSDPTLPNSQTFSVPPGTWTATELNIPQGWTLANLTCVDPTNNTTVSGAVATINLASNETVTCTYTDTKNAVPAQDLTVSKTAVASFTRTYAWNISKNVDKTQVNIADGGSATFNYAVDVTHDSGTDSAWQVTGEITVTNPNAADVTGVNVTDAINNGGTCSVTGGTSQTIPALGSKKYSYACTYASAPSPLSGTNTGTATWQAQTLSNGQPLTGGHADGTFGADFSNVTPTIVKGTVTVTDTFGGTLGTASYTDPSPTEFKYSRTESGMAGTCTKYDNTATITETNQSASKEVTVCVGKDPTVSKTAAGTFDRTYLWQISKDVDTTQVEIADGGSYTFHYTVNVAQTAVLDSGWTLAGKITVSNPNDWEAITADVSDVVDNGGTCTVSGGTSVSIPASGSKTLDYTCSFGSAPSGYSGTNTATATWDKATAFTPTGSASGSKAFTLSQLGSANKTVHVTDSVGGDLGTVTATDSAPFATATFTYDRTVSGAAGKCTEYDNTATITETNQKASQAATLCVGKDLSVSKTASGTFDREYLWKISKDVDKTNVDIAAGGSATFNYSVKVTPNGYTDSGWKLGGTITIANPNDWEDVTLTGVTDTLDSGGTCSIVDAAPYVVPKSGSLTLHYTCTTDGTSTSNTAAATWDKAAYFTPTGSASGDAAVSFGLAKETNKTITVIDDKTDPANPVTLGTWNWADGEHTFPYSLVKQGVAGKCTDYDNTALIKETGQTAGQSITVCVGLDLTVSKTAAGTFDRTYLWQISKDVDKTKVSIADGGSATFRYTVNVAQTGVSDSSWKLSGKITVSNPNDWEAITADVSDAVDNGGTCTVTGGTGVSIPANGSKTLDYTCSYASPPSSYSGTNTAAATWDKAAYATPTGSATGNKAFTLSQLGSTNKTVHVTDSYGGDLGTVTATDQAPFAAATFTYDRTESGVAGKCTEYDNTATITETDQSAGKTVTVCVGDDLSVSKTASGTFDRTYPWKISKDVDKTTVDIADGSSYTFHYTVSVEQTGVSDSGWTLSGKITIGNPNGWEDITLTGLTDTVDNGGTCTVEPGPYVVPQGGSLVVNYTCAYGSAPSSYSGTNTATANWDKAAAFTPTGSASGSTPFTLTQLGSTNKTVHITDSYGGDLGTVTATDSAPFAKATFTYDRTESGVAGKCTSYDNTAAITETGQSAGKTVTLCVAKDLTVSKTASGSFDRKYLWQISKAVDKTNVDIADGGSYTFHYTVNVAQAGFTDSGWLVTGKITVNNPNDWEAITADVTDAVDNGGTCTVSGGTNVSIPANGSKTFDYSCSYGSTPWSYAGTNTATATWDKAVYFTPNGSASGTAPFTLSQAGSTNQTVHVTDSYGGDLGTVTATDGNPLASATFTYDRTESGVAGKCTSYDNTATITETDQSAGKQVTLCVGKDLTVSKTAAGTFDRTYPWKISKDVDKTSVNIADGGSATFHYAVDVTQTGVSDSGWTLAGKITVTNPNDWEAITLTGLTDVVDNGGACTVGAGPYVIPKSGSLDIGYVCSYGSAPLSYSGTNTATATWDKAAAFTPTGSAGGSAPFTLSQLGATNKTVHVTDSFGGDLGTVTATDEAPFAKAAFTYDRTVSGVAGKCTTYDNTATIKETDQSASQTVTVCVGKDLTVSKTANPSFTRTWDWSITKDYDKSYDLFAGDTVTHGYKVSVDPTFTDSAWEAVGTITIGNPNDWEDITLTSLGDAVDNGGTCTVDPGPYKVLAGKSLDVKYTCSYASKPSSYTGTNTAAATWDKAAAFTPEDIASGAQGFEFKNPTEIDPVITVDDDNLTGENWSADRKPGAWTYTKPFACSTDPADYTDGEYSYGHTNTATINETGQSDTATVDVTCHWPQIKLTKTGDALSKIGDGVTYTIKLENNTPADAGLRDLSCTISDNKIGFSKTVTLASGAGDTSTQAFTIPAAAPDPFVNTASVTCKPVAATAPVVGSSTFSVSDSSTWSTNLFQPGVEIVKTGPLYATSGDVITYTFTINNKSSSDSPKLVLDSVSDDVLGNLKTEALAAGCDDLVDNGTCTFTKTYTVPDAGLQAYKKTNVVTVHYHPAGFPNDVTDTDDHTVIVAPRSQLTDTSFCPLPNNQFRLLYHLEVAPNIYRLQASNPGQFYMNGFYAGAPGSDFTMTIKVPYPFVTQEGAGNPIQIHDGTTLTSSGCYLPNPSLSGYTITTPAMTPTSSAGNQVITPEDYATKQLGQSTTVTVSGKVPATGMVYVTIHLDYGLKKTGSWKQAGTFTTNPVSGNSIADVSNTSLTIHGYEQYNFARTVGSDTSTTTPSSFNEFKKFAGFLGFVINATTEDPVANAKVVIYDPRNAVLTTQYTDADGYYMYAYKHTAKAATYTVKLPVYNISTPVTVKANGFAAVDFEVK